MKLVIIVIIIIAFIAVTSRENMYPRPFFGAARIPTIPYYPYAKLVEYPAPEVIEVPPVWL